MNFWRSLSGIAEVRLTSADITGALERIEKKGITVWDGCYLDPLHLQFSVNRTDLPKLKQLCKKRGDEVEELHHRGLFYFITGFMKRPVLTAGVILILALSLWVPTRVLFISVEGNGSVPAQQILEKAEACGIRFLASRRAVRSEKMKNALLEAMPQLQWAGVNTYGCTAVITVRQRNDLEQTAPSAGVAHIVAMRDGIIREITVSQGNALFQSGQAVKAGQIIVSGYVDCGLCIKGTRANAEIYADTLRELSAICPVQYGNRTTIRQTAKKYSLIFGKKRINFYKGSGISGSTCAKIYEEKCLTLPGGFVLPIAIAWETSYEYEMQIASMPDANAVLDEFAVRYLAKQMTAGSITSSNPLYLQNEQFCRLDGIYRCYEMIGMTQEEESLTGYE